MKNNINLISQIKNLIINQCANYSYFNNNIFNYCCFEVKNNVCSFFQESEYRCKYLEEHVLPLDNNLYLKYSESFHIDKSKYRKRCPNCNKTYLSSKKNKKYCEECAKLIRREKTRKRVRLFRDKKRRVVCNAFKDF